MNKNFLIILILLFSSLQQINGQETKTLFGRVIDSKSKKPINNVELFISGATVGTTTNEEGEYTLNSPYIPCHLVVMHVSYQSAVLTIGTSGNYDIELTKEQYGIDEVRVKGKNMRRRNLRLFYDYFLWNTTKRQIKVLNDSVLKFKRNDTDFHAYCTSPLLIRNEKLGYNMKMLIQDFHVCKKQFRSGKKLELNSGGHGVFKLKAYHYYTETGQPTAERRNEIRNNRRNHYFGSLRHFFTSLYHGKLKENGFLVKSKIDSIQYPFVLTMAQKDSKRYKFNSNIISVVYYEDYDDKPINLNYEYNGYRYHPSSFISLGKEFVVRSNGTSPHLLFEVKGSMGAKSPANTLPNDYLP